ncbi:MAG: NADP-dependent methylenetetrahydromethanopterin/methylenetetrahydrofolate dehydrogenase [Pirellulaceae bacterium]
MKKILLQLDTDTQSSSFDSVVAIDSDVDQLLRFDNVKPDEVMPLVHGCIFTRSPEELRNTAIFIGGNSVSRSNELLDAVKRSFFGPMRVSVLLDPNGCNTTAAAAVLRCEQHLTLKDCKAIVLAGTGPVGQRIATILRHQGARVTITSRSPNKLDESLAYLNNHSSNGQTVTGIISNSSTGNLDAVQGHDVVFAAGAAGVELLGSGWMQSAKGLKVAIDINAVPPTGLSGIQPFDKHEIREGITCYGAIGVGGLKMKIHKAAIRGLFSSNDKCLDTHEIFALGKAHVV